MEVVSAVELHRQCDDALVDASLDRALSVEQPSSVVLDPRGN